MLLHCRVWNLAESDLNLSMICGVGAVRSKKMRLCPPLAYLQSRNTRWIVCFRFFVLLPVSLYVNMMALWNLLVLLQRFYVFMSSFQTFVRASHILLAIIAFAEIAIAITHYVYCCTIICGPFKNEDAAVVSITMCNTHYRIVTTSDRSCVTFLFMGRMAGAFNC